MNTHFILKSITGSTFFLDNLTPLLAILAFRGFHSTTFVFWHFDWDRLGLSRSLKTIKSFTVNSIWQLWMSFSIHVRYLVPERASCLLVNDACLRSTFHSFRPTLALQWRFTLTWPEFGRLENVRFFSLVQLYDIAQLQCHFDFRSNREIIVLCVNYLATLTSASLQNE